MNPEQKQDERKPIGFAKMRITLGNGKKEKNIQFRVLVYMIGDIFYAHALELNQIGTGTNLNEAMEDLEENLDIILTELHDQTKKYIIKEAPKEYYNVFFALLEASKSPGHRDEFKKRTEEKSFDEFIKDAGVDSKREYSVAI